MSTILKALQKAEEVRTAHTLEGKILSDPVPRERVRRRAPLYVAGLGILIVIAAGVICARGRRAPSTAGQGPAVPGAPAAHAGAVRGSGRALRGSDAAIPDLHLSGVIWDPAAPVALINGQPLTVGQESGGARVIAISLDEVQVECAGMKHVLKVR
ncbi:MAG: hypothetical protein NT045_07130 [Candidatus Aureabacteria bacterium]|nr:hypothetical protein [Candidatus Auribacterota bacterium]